MQGKNSESVLRENNELKQQLREANAVILSLRQEVDALRRQLANLHPPATPPRQMHI
jgi:predicted RNase H-like nuclease (RuvC/YqgF family)